MTAAGRGTGRHPARHAGPCRAQNRALPTVTVSKNPRAYAQTPKCLNPVALGTAVPNRNGVRP